MTFKTVHDLDVKDKTVLLRADLNVPVNEHRKVTDTTRIARLKPTIDYLRAQGARIVVVSHFGRPKGQVNKEFSLAFLPPVLKDIWDVDVLFAADCIGETAQTAIESLSHGEVLLLENVRFHAGEEKNDPAFAKALAAHIDIFINDAFSAAHRAHASTEAIAHILPTAAGLLMNAELDALGQALENPKKPVIAIVGGAKISTKLSVLDNLVRKVDILFLGGGMANTFLYARNIEVGKSLCEKEMADEARAIMKTASEHNCMIMLPEKRVIVDKLEPDAPYEIADTANMPVDKQAVDAAPESIETLVTCLESAKTVLWKHNHTVML
jgi:phosphoglycerate kinase